MNQFVLKVNDLVPPFYKNQIILGEYGFRSEVPNCGPTITSRCTKHSVSDTAADLLYFYLFGDRDLKELAPVRMVWELADDGTWANPQGWGGQRLDFTPKPVLYLYLLQHDGIDLAEDTSRYIGFRARIANALRQAGIAAPSAATVNAFFYDWIMHVAPWDQLVSDFASDYPPESRQAAVGGYPHTWNGSGPNLTIKDPENYNIVKLDVSKNVANIVTNFLHSTCQTADPITVQCSAASSRLCAANGYLTGFGPTEYSGNDAIVTCMKKTYTRYVSSTWEKLAARHSGCTDSTKAMSGECNAAINRYCNANGYVGGFGVLEYSGPSVAFACFN